MKDLGENVLIWVWIGFGGLLTALFLGSLGLLLGSQVFLAILGVGALLGIPWWAAMPIWWLLSWVVVFFWIVGAPFGPLALAAVLAFNAWLSVRGFEVFRALIAT
jgi:uncharacterized oligopeptide transporter (OPT) family protein